MVERCCFVDASAHASAAAAAASIYRNVIRSVFYFWLSLFKVFVIIK